MTRNGRLCQFLDGRLEHHSGEDGPETLEARCHYSSKIPDRRFRSTVHLVELGLLGQAEAGAKEAYNTNIPGTVKQLYNAVATHQIPFFIITSSTNRDRVTIHSPLRREGDSVS